MHVRYAGVIALLVVAGAACGSSSSKASSTTNSTSAAASSSNSTSASNPYGGNPAPASTAPAATTAAIKVAKVGDDMLIVNGKGLTTYAFGPDSATASQCNTGCDTTWPPVTTTGAPPTMSGLQVTTLTRTDGTKQVVVNGHPLYTFSGDSKAGDEKGQGVGGVWYYVNSTGEPDKG